MNFLCSYVILGSVMGFRRSKLLPVRFLCRLMAAFWGMTTLLAAGQMAACRPLNAPLPRMASAASAMPVCHCAMCRSRQHHGMKCCCCGHAATPVRQACLCARCDLGTPRLVAVVVWSTPALPFGGYPLTLPPRCFTPYPSASQTALSVCRDPLPRPPRLL